MPDRWWPAPTPDHRLDATVSLPGSKSLTNRALLLSALASGPSSLRRPLRARDTLLMAAALRALGASVVEGVDASGTDTWTVTPRPLRGPAAVDCGLAGTVMRFVPPVAALADGPVRFDGDPRARVRPMNQTLQALRALGATVDSDGAGGLPFTVHGRGGGRGGVRGGVVDIDASGSSQFVSGLLLAGARFAAGVDVRHHGKPVPSVPHIEMTVAELRRRGVDVDDSEPNRWVVRQGKVAPYDCELEPDLSSAAPFLAAALVSAGRVRVTGWPEHTEQAGDELRHILAAMGACVVRDGTDLVVTGGDAVAGVALDLHDVGELTPVVAALCVLAEGTSQLSGVAHLRGHETDRLAAVATEVNRLGGAVTELADGLRIEPRPLRAGRWHTYADHRMAHAGAVLGLAVPGIEVEDLVATTDKSFAGFAEAWAGLVR